MADLFLCAVILFFGCILLTLPIIFLHKIFGIEHTKRPLIKVAILGALTLAYQKNQPFSTSIIGKILNFRTPLSKFLLSISNMLVGKIAGVSSNSALVDYFFTPYSVIDKTQENILIALLLALLMTAVSSLELYIIFFVFFPELYILVPIVLDKFFGKISDKVDSIFPYVPETPDPYKDIWKEQDEWARDDAFMNEMIEFDARVAQDASDEQRAEEQRIIDEEQQAYYDAQWEAYHNNNDEY